MDLRPLMSRVCDGDASAFAELYQQLAPALTGYLRRMVRDPGTADDLVQTTFIKVHQARHSYIRGADPAPWIYAIAHRTGLDELRRQKRSRVQVANDPARIPDAAAELSGHRQGEAPEPPATSGPARRALAALARLPDGQRQAVTLTKLEGKSVAEAAHIAGVSVTAMKVRAHRGYAALRAALAGDTAKGDES